MGELSPSGESLTLVEPGDGVASGVRPDHLYCPADRVVANWHNGVHEGAYSTCQEQPCNAVQRVCD